MLNRKHLLAVMVALPTLVALGIFAGMCTGSDETKSLITGIAMFGLAIIQLFVGVMVLGPRGLLNGYELAKK